MGYEGVAEVLEELDCMQRMELANNDSVTCAAYTHRILNAILYVLRDRRCSPFQPYVVIDFFKRVEFQQRPHPHHSLAGQRRRRVVLQHATDHADDRCLAHL